jgi:hypothetical protein
MAIVIDNLRVAAYVVYLGKVGEVVDYHSFGPWRPRLPSLDLSSSSRGFAPTGHETVGRPIGRWPGRNLQHYFKADPTKKVMSGDRCRFERRKKQIGRTSASITLLTVWRRNDWPNEQRHAQNYCRLRFSISKGRAPAAEENVGQLGAVDRAPYISI